MKRLIAAVSFAVLATPAFAETGKPFEQLDLDRALPQISFPTVESPTANTQVAAASGATRSDASSADQAPESARTTESPWANDWNFIAPPM
jgi:hypothetical protein